MDYVNVAIKNDKGTRFQAIFIIVFHLLRFLFPPINKFNNHMTTEKGESLLIIDTLFRFLKKYLPFESYMHRYTKQYIKEMVNRRLIC